MKNYSQSDLLITGLGITSSVGQGKAGFFSSLILGNHAFKIMQRPGRQKETSFIGAEIPELSFSEYLSQRLLRKASFSGHVAMVTMGEAWEEAKLDSVDPDCIGLIIGGSNIQQREIIQTYEAYRDKAFFISPTYGFSFMDSDLCGLCTEQFGVRGLAYTVGGASASGQLAVIQAIQAVQSGQVDICIAMGALMDISYLECQSLRVLGAMGTDRYANEPALACRPFDKNRDGFIYGEACGVVVIEREDTAIRRGVTSYAKIPGWAVHMDGNRNPNPSYESEVQVIKEALEQAKFSAKEIDYINPHGSGSIIGDEIEARAIANFQFPNAYINASKSIIGHSLSAAGIVEIIATLLQMRESQLHPTRNLVDPVDHSFNWVQAHPTSHHVNNALCLSMGFGGINTAICLQKC